MGEEKLNINEARVMQLAESLKSRHLVATMDEAVEMARRILAGSGGNEGQPQRLPSADEIEPVSEASALAEGPTLSELLREDGDDAEPKKPFIDTSRLEAAKKPDADKPAQKQQTP